MIRLTRISRQVVALNPDLIESVEETPDTTLTLTSGDKILVLEPLDRVVEEVIEYRRMLLSAVGTDPSHPHPHPRPAAADR
jgi:flagellar protein FlbD